MKKTLFLCIAAIASVFALNSCEDVPEPYKLPEGGGEPEVPVLNEITCAEALALFGELEDGETSSESYVITGYIVDVYSNISKNQQSFWISDTKGGEKMIQAYWANLPEGVEAFTVGSQVKITGKLLKYVNANTGAMVPEVKNANVEILGEGGGDEPVVPGTEVTCAKAAELCNALADGATSEETYTISGFITDVFATVSRNQQSFWMADTKDGGKVIQAYWANLPEGVAEFKVGSEVKITGKLLKYVNANTGAVVPEVKNATVEIISEGEGGDEPGGGDEPQEPEEPSASGITVSGNIITLAVEGVTAGTETHLVDLNAQGYENAQDVTTVSDGGCTITFGSGANTTNTPKFYTATKGVRMYANNVVTFTADKTIATITLTCDEYSGTTYVGNDTRTLDVNSNVFTLTNKHTDTKGGVQMRIKTVEFTFAE